MMWSGRVKYWDVDGEIFNEVNDLLKGWRTTFFKVVLFTLLAVEWNKIKRICKKIDIL